MAPSHKALRFWLLVGLCGLAFAVRAHGLTAQSLWRDEVDSIRFALQPWPDLTRVLWAPGQNGVLYFVLLRPWLLIAGRSEYALRWFSLAFGVLAVPLLHQVGRRLAPRSPALGMTAAVLAAVSPYLVWYGQEGKMYSLTVCAVLLSVYSLFVAIQRGGWRPWLGFAFFTTVACYLHLVAALMIPALVAIFLCSGGWRHADTRKAFAVSLTLVALPYLPLLVWQAPMLWKSAETGYAFVPLHEMVGSLVSSFWYGVVGVRAWWQWAALFGIGAAGILLAWREVGRRAACILACWFLVPVLCLFLISLRRPIYTARYLIFVAPALLLLLAAPVASLGRRSRALAVVWLVALLATQGYGDWVQATTALKADFRAATQYLVSRLGPRDLILFQIPYGRYAFEYYFTQAKARPSPSRLPAAHQVYLPSVAGGGGTYRWADGLYTNAGMDGREAAERMEELLDGTRVVWLVETEAAMWDERGLVRGWLDANARLTEVAHFVRVDVYRYELAPEQPRAFGLRTHVRLAA